VLEAVVALDGAAELMPVHLRHHEIAEDEVGGLFAANRQAVGSRGRERQVEIVLQQDFHQLEDLGVVVDHQEMVLVLPFLVGVLVQEIDLFQVRELKILEVRDDVLDPGLFRVRDPFLQSDGLVGHPAVEDVLAEMVVALPELDDETRSVMDPALGVDPALVEQDDFLGQRQADARAFVRPRQGAVNLGKPVEDARDHVLGDAGPRVLDRQDDR